MGPDEKQESLASTSLAEGVDYEVPDHEQYRTARRSKMDEQCDAWFEKLLNNNDNHGDGILGPIADEVRLRLTTPVPLVNEERKPREDEENFTPYVSTRLPWSVLYPAYGVEQFGIPTPRRNSEAWRHFDVPGMINQDYSSATTTITNTQEWTTEQIQEYKQKLETAGGWLEDEDCEGRLVYINGCFVPELSKTTDVADNLSSYPQDDELSQNYLRRLTDGFTDELVCPVSHNDKEETSYSRLSAPNHCVGSATSQFAINTQQGSACFAALNTIKTKAVAYIHAKENNTNIQKPVLVVNAVTNSGGCESGGTAVHPRTLAIAEDGVVLSIVQSCVDLDDGSIHKPKLYNGYTQIFIGKNTNVTHSYLEETGGIVTAGVERPDEDFEDPEQSPRTMEAQRPALSDTHLESIDVHVKGEGRYEGTLISMGGSGRVRLAQSVTLLQPGAHATINGFSLSGGIQKTDMKTNIHHAAQGCSSEQNQKNMIGGRATGSFRGRIRVEETAQQTNSQQLSRTVLLTDKARAWAVPSLEIIADDVKCTHGATVSDLSEEELFYLRSRGLGQSMARNLLMFAFCGEITACVDDSMLGSVDSEAGLQSRIIRRLENLVPHGERAVRYEYQSI